MLKTYMLQQKGPEEKTSPVDESYEQSYLREKYCKGKKNPNFPVKGFFFSEVRLH